MLLITQMPDCHRDVTNKSCKNSHFHASQVILSRDTSYICSFLADL